MLINLFILINIRNMLLALAICHTVVLTKDNENNNLYSATSPDELVKIIKIKNL